MRRLTLTLAAAFAATLVFAACGEKEAPKAEEPKARENNGTPTAKEGPEEPKAEEHNGTPTAKEGPEEPKAEEHDGTPTAKEEATPTAKEEPAPAPAEAKTAYDLVKPLVEAGRYLPDGLLAVAVLDLSAVDNLASTLLPGGALFNIPEEKQKALEEELASYHKKKLGFAVRQVDSAVFFVTATGDVGILIKGVIEEAADKAVDTQEVEGHRLIQLGQPPDLQLFSIKDFGLGLYVPKTVALADYLKASGERKDAPDRFAAFKKDLGSRTDVWYMTVVDFTNPLFALVWPPDAPVARPDRAVFAFKNTGLLVELEAGSQCLDDIDKWIKMGKAQGKMLISAAKAKLDDLEVAEGTAVIFADALFEDAFNALAPKRSEGKMTLEMDLEVWGAMPVIAILSSVAVPAFIKYQRKAKTAEAIDMLDKIAKGAADYYSTPRVNMSGNFLQPHFPPSVAATPPPGSCCSNLGGADADGDDRCDVSTVAWASETWSALHFQMNDQHYFTYEFKSNGKTGAEAAFEAIAYGDLDCDGIRSTFARTGKGVQQGPYEFSVEFGHMYMESETE